MATASNAPMLRIHSSERRWEIAREPSDSRAEHNDIVIRTLRQMTVRSFRLTERPALVVLALHTPGDSIAPQDRSKARPFFVQYIACQSTELSGVTSLTRNA